MNKHAIAKTAVCYWSKKYKDYIVESPLFAGCSGVGSTEEEAKRIFLDLLSDAYEAYLEGRVPGYARPGRPAKRGVPFNTNVKPETKKIIQSLSEDIGCSFGEVIDFLAFAYTVRDRQSAHSARTATNGVAGSVAEKRGRYPGNKALTLEGLAKRLDALEAQIQTSSATRRRRSNRG